MQIFEFNLTIHGMAYLKALCEYSDWIFKRERVKYSPPHGVNINTLFTSLGGKNQQIRTVLLFSGTMSLNPKKSQLLKIVLDGGGS